MDGHDEAVNKAVRSLHARLEAAFPGIAWCVRRVGEGQGTHLYVQGTLEDGQRLRDAFPASEWEAHHREVWRLARRRIARLLDARHIWPPEGETKDG